ncbi:hypothetical protein M0R45_020748 [Rubus argutus]|uniref:non-specific serine/threonine protein kinase n=1 Tax=Rubus argutus TaxID=59490 RepID=A0AAW1XCS7_RUBAR
MHTYLLFEIISFTLVVISSTCLIFQVPPSFAADDDDQQYLQCSQTFQCANLQHIGYPSNNPFWGPSRPRYCGFPGFNLSCSSDNAMISFNDQYYRVLSINQSETTLKVARADYGDDLCVLKLSNTTIHSSHLEYASDVQELVLLYTCNLNNVPIIPRYDINCSISASTEDLINYIVTKQGITYGCGITVTLNVSQSAAANLAPNSSMESVAAALNDGFGLVWDANNSLCEQCRSSGGQCGYNYKSTHFSCYCKDGPNPSNICGGSSPPSTGSSSPSPGSSPPSTGSSSPSPGSCSLSRDWIIGLRVQELYACSRSACTWISSQQCVKTVST